MPTSALNVDPHGLCKSGCTDISTRNFAGSAISDNTFISGPRTGFGFGVEPRHPTAIRLSPGRCRSHRDKQWHRSRHARVNVGLDVSGMFDATLTGNAGHFILTRINGCPLRDRRPASAQA